MRRIARHENIGKAWHREIGLNLDPTGVVCLSAKPHPCWRGHYTSRPGDGCGFNSLLAERHAVCVATCHGLVESNFNVELEKRPASILRKTGIKRDQKPRRRLDKNDTG